MWHTVCVILFSPSVQLRLHMNIYCFDMCVDAFFFQVTREKEYYMSVVVSTGQRVFSFFPQQDITKAVQVAFSSAHWALAK